MANLLGILGKCRCLAVPMLVLAAVAAVTVAGAVETRAERAARRATATLPTDATKG